MKTIRAALILGILLLVVLIGSQTRDISSGDPSTLDEANPREPASPKAAGSLAGQSPSASAASSPQGNPAPLSRVAAPGAPPSPPWTSLAEMMSRDSEGLDFTSHADGHTSVHGSGRFTQVAAGVRDASGRMVIQCFCDYTALDGALSGLAVPVPYPTKEIEYEVSDF